jgi:quercetin dioxygenase-like cupin family protein
MREIRTFELEHGEPAAAWHVTRPLILTAAEGEVWLTLEGDSEDYWLAPGRPFTLPAGARAWVSAGRNGARFALAFASAGPGADPPTVPRARGWMPRWLQAA